ncbi:MULTISPECIES: alpha/beta hydrolase [unclassified Streptomyces]|uniref:alpha/beta fold hydrolase n=1 Tax=unclassified Streptomyces TaxID=2593676 RepID=UPI0023667146|nr:MULTISPECIES: alpha/beta hydrolase [unclassified Streptomyces]MDF3141182.1 alpha/beta hydrolase [Streptomyces sp. T21Q-yed]WDF42661.1 alpha/beta hydrolase [Streptomyces sp. T12]
MTALVDRQKILAAAGSDKELAYKLRTYSGRVRFDLPEGAFDLVVEDGVPARAEEVHADLAADVTFSAPAEFWSTAFSAAVPPAGYESCVVGMTRGLRIVGDFGGTVAPWQSGWARLYQVVRETVAGAPVRKPFQDPFRETDNAVGRYVYVSANGQEARIYYETSGHGPIPLLLQATAGADGRQYRHLLADPRMQGRFTMYAYDLPYHGKSLPPIGVRWWEETYRPGRDGLINWVVAIADTLGLDNPYFMGCSVGGQLALDLAAERGDRFGAFISLNGWYGNPPLFDGFSNDMFRTPSIADSYAPALNFGATAPQAPEPNAHETYWIYRSAFPGIYAGDNDYFAYEHDLKENGHKIDAHAKPVYVVTGEYDPASDDDVNGGPAVEKFIPGAKFIKVAGLGHFAPCDDPIGFGDAIVPILDEVIAKAASAGQS